MSRDVLFENYDFAIYLLAFAIDHLSFFEHKFEENDDVNEEAFKMLRDFKSQLKKVYGDDF